jgi:dTMP kinase
VCPKNKPLFVTPLTGVDPDELTGKLIIIEGADGSGRSTQMNRITQWLEVEGYGVVNTGWTRSPLMSDEIDRAKEGHTLNPTTFSLLYVADFADRLENQIIPALNSGFIVLADRYIYTAFARNAVRGLDRKWTRKVYGFALEPDLVLYLKCDLEHLIPRMLRGSGMGYWESGMDLHLGPDIYDSFVAYQTQILSEFDAMAKEYSFKEIDASRSVKDVFEGLQKEIKDLMGMGNES